MARKPKQYKEPLYKQLWRPMIAYAFIVIILFDFVIAPLIVLGMIKAGFTLALWHSLTLDSNGFFYLSIGAILGAATWTRGREKEERLRQGYVDDGTSYDNGSTDGPEKDPGPPQ